MMPKNNSQQSDVQQPTSSSSSSNSNSLKGTTPLHHQPQSSQSGSGLVKGAPNLIVPPPNFPFHALPPAFHQQFFASLPHSTPDNTINTINTNTTSPALVQHAHNQLLAHHPGLHSVLGGLNNPMQHIMSNLLNNLIKQDHHQTSSSNGNCYNNHIE